MPSDQQYSDSQYSLFSGAEQKRLQSFLDGLDKTDNLDASNSAADPNNQQCKFEKELFSNRGKNPVTNLNLPMN
ncbi:hypothetical protein EC973_008910 [Apophysomyces ossiformis]|uniref:Uncharacterized protein n=1 Tax=Apophysomyces ossiformis TaxID=679940 RepID=A0A8H7ETC3_9FUNG|nr:hypothetical protein EC973_008910 [Apophysomyces ossiformis]